MSDTPRTDNAEFACGDPRCPSVHVTSYFAKELELELATALKALEQIEFYAQTGVLQDSFDEIKRIAKSSLKKVDESKKRAQAFQAMP